MRIAFIAVLVAAVCGCHPAPTLRVHEPSSSAAAADECERMGDLECATQIYDRIVRGEPAGHVDERAQRQAVEALRKLAKRYAGAAATLDREYSDSLGRLAASSGTKGTSARDITIVAEVGSATRNVAALTDDIKTIKMAVGGGDGVAALLQAKLVHSFLERAKPDDAARFVGPGLEYVLTLPRRLPGVKPVAVVLLLQEVASDEYEVALVRADVQTAARVVDSCLSAYPDTVLVDEFYARARRRNADTNSIAIIREAAARYHVTSSVTSP